MASIAMLIGGALANAIAFTENLYLFSRLSKDSIDAKRKRHDEAIQGVPKKVLIKNFYSELLKASIYSF